MLPNWLTELTRLHTPTTLRAGKGGAPTGRRRARSARLAAAAAVVTEQLEPRALFSATWDGGGTTNLWTDADNWVGDVAPTAVEDLVFPAASSRLTPVNDFAAGTHFASVTIDAGGYDLSGNPLAVDGSGGVTATYASGAATIDLDIELGDNETFNVASGGRLDVVGSVSGGYSLTKSGGGTLQLLASNSYSGGTLVGAGGLTIRDGLALGTGDVTIYNPGALALAGGITVPNTIHNFSAGTGIVSDPSYNRITGPIDLFENVTIDVAPGGTLELAGTVSQSNPTRTLTKTGPGLLQVDLASTYTGGTDVKAGTLKSMDDRALGTSGLVFVEGGATLHLDVGTFDLPAGGLYLGNGLTPGSVLVDDGHAHTLYGNLYLLGGGQFDVPNGSLLDVAGSIQGNGTLRLPYTNTGTLVLSGNNTFSGSTYVENGTLLVDGVLSSNSDVVLVGGTLAGSGSVGQVGGPSGAVAPGGGGPGALATNDLYLSPGTTLVARIDGATAGSQYSRLDVVGTVSLSGATLSLSLGYAPAAGDVYTLVANDGSDAVNGTLAGLPEGATLTIGADTFAISYAGGDGNDVTLTAVAPSTTTVAASAASSTVGEPVTFTATVATSGLTPTGSVTLYVDGNPYGPVALDGAGQATFVLSTLGAGTHSVAADYSGNGGVLASSASPISQVVAQAATTTVLAPPVAPSAHGEAVTFTATVAPVAPGGGIPTGTVTFRDGAALLGVATLDGTGVASFSTAGLAVGNHAVHADFDGTADYASSSVIVTQTVNLAQTTVGVSTSASPSVWGQAVTVTATVATVAPGGGVPTGSVDLFDGATFLGTATLDGSGTATLSTNALPIGSHALTAVYTGDVEHAPATSPAATQVVDQAATTATVVASPDPSVYGQAVTLTASVAVVAPGAGLPTGLVTFYDGPTTVGQGTLGANGVATATVTFAATGPHSVTAVYAGDTDFAGTTSAAAPAFVHPGFASVALATSDSASYPGQTVTFTATLAVLAPGAGVPTGTVSFMDGGTLLAAVPVDPAGTATFATNALAEATHPIFAFYSGDAHFVASLSPPLSQVVENHAPTTTPVPAVVAFEDAGPTAIDLRGNFADAEQPAALLTYTLVGTNNPTLFDDASVNDGTLTLTYAPDAFGTATVTVRATDELGRFVDATVAVTVVAVNDAPSFYIAADPTVQEDSGVRTIGGFATDISRGPTNELSQTVAFVVTNDHPALFAVQPRISATGALTFTPAANAHGVAVVSVRMTDSGGTASGGQDATDTQSFALTIIPVNDAPVAAGDAVATDEDVPATGNVLANDADVDGDTLSAVLASGPAHGTLTLNANGSFAYTPAADYFGPDSFTYRANDGTRNSGLTTVSVTVAPVAEPGSVGFAAAAYAAAEGGGTLTLTVTRSGGTEGAATVGFAVTGGTATNGSDYVLAAGTVSFADGQSVATISVPLTDDAAHEASETAVVTLSNPTGGMTLGAATTTTVTIADNDNFAPTAGDVTVTRAPGATAMVTPAAADADGDALTLSVATQPAGGTVTVAGGAFLFTPAAGAHGVDSFQYAVADGRGGTATGTAMVAAAGVGLDANPADPTKTDLVVVGTGGTDNVRFAKLRTGGVRVTANGADLGVFKPTGRIVAYGLGGDDVITAKGVIDRGVLFYGGAGNDSLTGGNGADVLVGGDGDDTLVGNGRRDVLIGGAGADKAKGGSGDDALVADATAYDAPSVMNRLDLEVLAATWNGPGTLAQRTAQLGNGAVVNADPAAPAGARLAAGTLVADDARDELVDGSGSNWLLGGSTANDLLMANGGKSVVTRL
jgi:autotransporter-associated beta strand protein/VCBS repeat-containing protein